MRPIRRVTWRHSPCFQAGIIISGCSEVIIEHDRLAKGDIVVSRAKGIFSDGLLFDVPAADSAPASKALAEYFERGVTNLDVYLAIPDYRPRGINVSMGRRDENTRYV